MYHLYQRDESSSSFDHFVTHDSTVTVYHAAGDKEMYVLSALSNLFRHPPFDSSMLLCFPFR